MGFFLIETGTESTKWSVHRETEWQMWWQGTVKETENKGGYLEQDPFFDLEPVKHLEKILNILMCAFAKQK